MSKEELMIVLMLCEFWLENIAQEETDKETFLEVIKIKEYCEGV